LIPGDVALVDPGGSPEFRLRHACEGTQKDHHEPKDVRITPLRHARSLPVPDIRYGSLVNNSTEGCPRGHGGRGGALSREPPCSPPHTAAQRSSSCWPRSLPHPWSPPPLRAPKAFSR